MNKHCFSIKILPAILFLVALSSCGQPNSNKIAEQTTESAISIDTFNEFPPEIDGCSCYFSDDSTAFKNHVYIYMNDYKLTSFIKINGVPAKFTKLDEQEDPKGTTVAHYKNNAYELRIEIKDGPRNGDETSLKTGTIELTDQHGKSIKKTFYGECGC